MRVRLLFVHCVAWIGIRAKAWWFFFSTSYLLCSHHLISPLSRDAKTIASHLVSPFLWHQSIHLFSCSSLLQQISLSLTLDLAISPSTSPSTSTHRFASFLFLCWCEIGTKCFEGFEQHCLAPQMMVFSPTINLHHNHYHNHPLWDIEDYSTVLLHSILESVINKPPRKSGSWSQWARLRQSHSIISQWRTSASWTWVDHCTSNSLMC